LNSVPPPPGKVLKVASSGRDVIVAAPGSFPNGPNTDDPASIKLGPC
jgi:hypothetical protein